VKLPTYAQHRRFCEVEGWQDKDKLAGRRKGDHHRYVLTLATGEQLYTRVSHGSGSYHDHSLWSAILREQLRVTAEDFWACVDHGRLPPRPVADRSTPANAIPGQLAWQLIKRAGIPEAVVRSMTKEEAVEAFNRFQAAPRPGP
jgi:hypothetical protein